MTYGSKYWTSTKRGAAPVRALGDRPRELVLPVVGADGDDLAGLDVRAERDREVGQPGEEESRTTGGVYAAGSGLTARYQPTIAVGDGGASCLRASARFALAVGEVEVPVEVPLLLGELRR